jgi:hypothetical protein
MKNFKLYMALIVMVTIFCANTVFAQKSSKNVPATVVAAFTSKYPKAEIKNWDISNDEFTAKAKEGDHKFYVTFDNNGTWVKTASKINWSWNLPADVRASLKSSKYAGWRVDGVKKIESPTGEFYQVLVDNVYLQVDADHAVFAENWIVNFKPGGEIFATQSISSPLLF